VLTVEVRYDVPEQDLAVDWSRIPAIPAGRFVITNVRR
jgi:fatty-acid peroxygenase